MEKDATSSRIPRRTSRVARFNARRASRVPRRHALRAVTAFVSANDNPSSSIAMFTVLTVT